MSDKWMSVYRYWQKTGQVKEEEAMFQYIQKQYPQWLSHYWDCLQKARQTVLKKTVEGFLRENIGGIAERLKEQLPEQVQLSFPVSYRFFPLQKNQWLVFPIQKVSAFHRYLLEGDMLLVTSDAVRSLQHVVEWLALVYPHLAESVHSQHWLQLVTELCNAGANQTLAYLWQKIKRKEQPRSVEEQCNRWVENSGQDPSLYFEQICVEGHPLHPCAKTRLGLQPEEVDQYAAECRNEPSLHFVAVREGWVESTWAHPDEYHAFLLRCFPEIAAWLKPMARAGYRLLPVHEWQLKRMIPRIYQKEIKQKIVIPLSEIQIPAIATSSFRTLFPLSTTKQHLPVAIKVAVNSQMTSTIRSISPQTTINSKRFSELLAEVLRREPQLSEKLVPLYELGGCCFKSSDQQKRRNLSVVFREVPCVPKEELPIVASSLLEPSSVTEKPMIADVLALYAATHRIQSMPKAAEQFLLEYIRLVLQVYLPLMVKYGIGLEGHLQNSVPVFRHGQPVRMLIRDWGGARIYKPRLKKQGIRLTFYPNSLTVTTKVEKMQEKVFYTVYQSHLGQLILQLTQLYGLSEEKLWKDVGDMSEALLEQMAQEPQFAEAVQQDRSFLFQAQVPCKALTTMRLFPDREQYIRVTNPLFGHISCLPT